MNSHPSPAQTAASSPLHLSDLLLGAATVPLLLGLVAGRILAKTIQEAGLLSEEVFRGDRLPILATPIQPSDSSIPTDDVS